jgi:hypothetical protein
MQQSEELTADRVRELHAAAVAACEQYGSSSEQAVAARLKYETVQQSRAHTLANLSPGELKAMRLRAIADHNRRLEARRAAAVAASNRSEHDLYASLRWQATKLVSLEQLAESSRATPREHHADPTQSPRPPNSDDRPPRPCKCKCARWLPAGARPNRFFFEPYCRVRYFRQQQLAQELADEQERAARLAAEDDAAIVEACAQAERNVELRRDHQARVDAALIRILGGVPTSRRPESRSNGLRVAADTYPTRTLERRPDGFPNSRIAA